METTIRLALEYDILDVVRLYNYFGENEIDSMKAGWIWEKMKWQENAHLYVLCEPNNFVIGAAILSFSHKLIHGGTRVGRIDELVIDVTYRNQGLGEVFVDFLAAKAVAEGCYKLLLECKDERLGFYERCGFHRAANSMRMDLEGK